MLQLSWHLLRRFRNTLNWLWNLEGSPIKRALGLGLGVFSGCFPLFGLQTILGLTLARLFKANYVLAATGTWISNPITYLPLYWFNYQVGCLLIGHDAAQESFIFPVLGENLLGAWVVIFRLVLGSFFVGLVAGFIVGALVYFALIRAYKLRKSSRN